MSTGRLNVVVVLAVMVAVVYSMYAYAISKTRNVGHAQNRASRTANPLHSGSAGTEALVEEQSTDVPLDKKQADRLQAPALETAMSRLFLAVFLWQVRHPSRPLSRMDL